MKSRARIVSGLAALAALFLAPLAEASLTRPSNPAREAPALALTLAAPELSEFSLFDGTEIARALASRPALISISTDEEQTAVRTRFVSPSELSADELPNDAPELLPITSVREQRFNLQLPPDVFGLEPLRGPPGDEASYPKTRYRVFDFLGAPLVGVERGVSLELHWGCASFSCGLSSGTVGWLSQDPAGDTDSVNLYGFVGARPHEKTDPLGLCPGCGLTFGMAHEPEGTTSSILGSLKDAVVAPFRNGWNALQARRERIRREQEKEEAAVGRIMGPMKQSDDPVHQVFNYVDWRETGYERANRVLGDSKSNAEARNAAKEIVSEYAFDVTTAVFAAEGLLTKTAAAERAAVGSGASAVPGAIGSVEVPAGAKWGTTTFGNEMHSRIAAWLEKKYPETQFEFRIKPGQTGVDVKYIEGPSPGFKEAEIKPRSTSGQRSFGNQLEKWGKTSQEVMPITYDAEGNIFGGW